jgi:hypothetical protein
MKRTIIFTGCDGVYFDTYAEIFTASFEINSPGQVIFFSVCNPLDSFADRIEALKARCGATEIVYETYTTDLSELNEQSRRAYYANHRFIRLHDFVYRYGHDIIFLDIDSIVRNKLDSLHKYFLDIDIAMRLRLNTRNINMKVLAAGIYIKAGKNSLRFLDELGKRLNGACYWYADQVEIYNSLLSVKGIRVANLSARFFDYEFSDDSMIWTGKGNRKFLNERYTLYASEIVDAFRRLSRNVSRPTLEEQPVTYHSIIAEQPVNLRPSWLRRKLSKLRLRLGQSGK